MTRGREAWKAVGLTREVEAVHSSDRAQATLQTLPALEPLAALAPLSKRETRTTRTLGGSRSERGSRPSRAEPRTEVIPIQPMDGDQEHEVDASPVRPFVRFVVDSNRTSALRGPLSSLLPPFVGPMASIPTAGDPGFAETFVRHP